MTLLKIPQNKLRKLASEVTQARVGLNQTGGSLSTNEILKFNLDHALARDAIHKQWDVQKFEQQLLLKGLKSCVLNSQINTKEEYLLNPPKGGDLKAESIIFLKTNKKSFKTDICIIVSNGLSTHAIDNHGIAFCEMLVNALQSLKINFTPIMLVPFSRVKLSNEIGALLNSKFVIMCIGERPGLSAHNSMGVYITPNPKLNSTNADRKCISNIRPPHGLGYTESINQILQIISTKRIQNHEYRI